MRSIAMRPIHSKTTPSFRVSRILAPGLLWRGLGEVLFDEEVLRFHAMHFAMDRSQVLIDERISNSMTLPGALEYLRKSVHECRKVTFIKYRESCYGEQVPWSIGFTSCGKELMDAIKTIVVNDATTGWLELAPIAQLATRFVQRLDHANIGSNTLLDLDAARYEAALDALRKDYNSRLFHVKDSNFQRIARRRLDDAWQYTDSLFQRHGDLYLVCVVLAYKCDFYSDKSMEPMDILHRIHLGRAKLVRKLYRDRAQPSPIGWLAKTECRIERHYQIQLMVFYQANKVSDVEYLGVSIGQHWSEVTSGKGLCVVQGSIPAHSGLYGLVGFPDRRTRQVFGFLKRDDMLRRRYLRIFLFYQFRPDFFMRLRVPEGTRMFVRGQL